MERENRLQIKGTSLKNHEWNPIKSADFVDINSINNTVNGMVVKDYINPTPRNLGGFWLLLESRMRQR